MERDPAQVRVAVEAVAKCFNPDPNNEEAMAPVRSTEFYLHLVETVIEVLDR